nr:unnamed protein product [Callosobruchus chinensis]
MSPNPLVPPVQKRTETGSSRFDSWAFPCPEQGSHLFGSQHEGQIHPRFDDKVTEISDVRDPHIKTSDLHFSENLPDIDNSEPQVTSNLGSKNSVEPLFVSKANDNRPYLSVCIDNENITALLDSGSNANILGSSELYLLRKLNLNIDYNTALQLTTADGQIQNTLGFVYLPITFNGEDCKIKVLVVPSISHQLILGIDFILQFKLNINFGNFSYQSCAIKFRVWRILSPTYFEKTQNTALFDFGKIDALVVPKLILDRKQLQK